ncbi:hypothetical protein PUN28_015164 [Cardiocondyla obscurior]|uniref:Uncharacterized protein n=1 Tax=Cardiocondyla obscurior TaxID=286306 RepID=A0AAW2F0S6_9HYME
MTRRGVPQRDGRWKERGGIVAKLTSVSITFWCLILNEAGEKEKETAWKIGTESGERENEEKREELHGKRAADNLDGYTTTCSGSDRLGGPLRLIGQPIARFFVAIAIAGKNRSLLVFRSLQFDAKI